MALAIAVRYAQALTDVVLEPGTDLDPAATTEQLRAVEEIVAGSAALRNILLNPGVAVTGKRAVVARLADRIPLHELVRNFIYVLIDRRRIGLIKEIRQAFEDIIDESSGVVRADVRLADELDDAKRDELREALAGLTGKKVRCEYEIDEGLLGGARVQVDSTVYDGSVSGQLEALRKRLVK